ncbi:SusC/RagA family TonB-linked outer membrane protein [Pedobacter punctiformis]|uniref:SusC/RagA family TonB-linked outer membrane protein n=1 Tax=Pedobacter punctiformis TaxID=3004097 RepID=A0ABT4L9Q5_9SPHI|nr:SusC/RagA family TonB-linked outer membrane protein [Pedobacter sp. HCMS5-2]MCZ4243539.1 SusC/RagA family TonB-linked outer membrane protein [Pedobacter sp. HCMS5-2]
MYTILFNALSKRQQYIQIILSVIFLLLVFNASAQVKPPFTIKGKVTDLDGKRISVSVRSAKSGMAGTDEDGNFTLQIKRLPDTLWFSAIGYVSIFKSVLRNDFINVRMTPKIEQLEEVLVQTGYQSLKPNEINGTVSVINEQALNSRAGTNILDRLAGQSSGLLFNVGKSNGNPQSNLNISIRGLGTINGPLDPLIVLDGYIYEGDINNINPNDIDNVSILKDAAAASIWGARAGNGVMVISTKKGKLNQPLQIGFNASAMVQAKPDLFAIREMSASDYIEVERKLFNSGYFDNQIAQSPFQALTPAVEILFAQRSAKISAAQASTMLADLAKNNTQQSYSDHFYTQAITQQYGLNIKGGGNKNTYFLSAAYDKQKGETYTTADKLNIRLSNDFKLLDKLTLATNVYFTSLKTNSGRPVYKTIGIGNRFPVYLSFLDADGNAIEVARKYRSNYIDTAGNGKLLNWKYYPAEDYKHSTVAKLQQELFASAALKYQLLSYLSLNLSYQYQKQNTNSKAFSDPESYAARDLINTYSQLNRSTGVVKYIVPPGGIQDEDITDIASQTGRFQLNLNKNIGVHVINAIAGVEARNVETNASGVTRYGYREDPLYFSLIDPVTSYPEFLGGDYSQISTDGTLLATHYRFVSLYANAAYSYRGKYSISGSIRRDGSNIFGANTNDKWKPLWSAGIGWSLSNESFYNVEWLPFLKLSATFGYSGNVDLTKTASAVASYLTYPVTGLPFTRVSNINNPNLKWEQLSQFNLKVDFASPKERLTGSVAWYLKKGSDLYGEAPYDYTTWGARGVLVRNIADMKGYGVDAELHSQNVATGTFKWNTDLYLSYNASKTVKYYREQGSDLSALLSSGSSITPVVGKPLYAIARYKWAGLDASGNPQGYLNGKVSTNYSAMQIEAFTTGNNLEYLGAASPTVFGSFINTFKYKAFSISLNFSYRLGYYLSKSSINYGNLVTFGQGHGDYEKRWQKSGDEILTNVPAFVYPVNQPRDAFYLASTINAIKGDNIRLDYINLSYKFNTASWHFPFRNLEAYAIVQNCALVWKASKENVDPDYADVIPPARQFSFGLRGNF